jgi:hypothetical protein
MKADKNGVRTASANGLRSAPQRASMAAGGSGEGSLDDLRLAVPLRSGDAVMFDPSRVGAGLDELASALCDVFFAEAGKTKPADWEASANEVSEEIGWAVEALGDTKRCCLLELIVWDQFCRHYGRIGRAVNKRARIAELDKQDGVGK